MQNVDSPILYHKVAKLTALGLDWEPGNAGGPPTDEGGWKAQLVRLAAYKTEHGDCNVPQRWAKDARLANWVEDPPRHFRP